MPIAATGSTPFVATNAASSGVKIDRKLYKQLAQRSDRPGVIWLAQWVALLAATSTALALSMGGWWVVPAMILHATVLSVPAYALSHEAAHGSAFRSRQLNEALFYISCFLYYSEPLHRRYAHTSHHTATWHMNQDAQMPFDTPMTFGGWLWEVSGLPNFWYETKIYVLHAFSSFSDEVRAYTPAGELPKLARNARIYLALYALLLAAILAGQTWILWYILLPRLIGAAPVQMFTTLQHAELQENSPSILASTRTFRTSWFGRFLYMNMNHHVEHHLYPQAPFHALPTLHEAIKDQTPTPDAGFFRLNLELAVVTLRRSLGLSTKAPTMRQAAHMVSEGGAFTPIAKASMR